MFKVWWYPSNIQISSKPHLRWKSNFWLVLVRKLWSFSPIADVFSSDLLYTLISSLEIVPIVQTLGHSSAESTLEHCLFQRMTPWIFENSWPIWSSPTLYHHNPVLILSLSLQSTTLILMQLHTLTDTTIVILTDYRILSLRLTAEQCSLRLLLASSWQLSCPGVVLSSALVSSRQYRVSGLCSRICRSRRCRSPFNSSNLTA